jgi:hypothetical protein
VLASMAATLIPGAPAVLAGEPPGPAIRDDDPANLGALRAYLSKAEIFVGDGARTRHYLVFDNSDTSLRINPGRFFEAMLANAMELFERAGLAPRTPDRRLTVVILDQEPFDRLASLDAPSGARGMYIRDWRTAVLRLGHQGDDPSDALDWEGTLGDFGHELTHQICYNAGLLNTNSLPPACISEGLAMLGEVSSWATPHLLKQASLSRLKRLPKVEERGGLPLAQMFRDDDLWWGKETPYRRSLDAYSWAWLLVYVLLTEDDLRPRFRDYLRAIATRTDKSHRVEDARRHLGDLDALQARLQRRMRHLVAKPPSRYTSVRRLPART